MKPESVSVPPTEAAPVSPAEIIELMLEEFHAEILEMRYSNLVRSIFHVYLSSKDMRRLGPVLERTKAEANRALNEALATLNKKKKLRLPGISEQPKRYEAIGDGWKIEFHENTDDDADENPLIIQSEFGAPHKSSREADDRIGTETVRITKRQVSGLTTTTTETIRTANMLNRTSGGTVYATFAYEDERGSQQFEMTKDRIKIGRGAVDTWVDLRLHSKKDISREHVQVRLDAATGKFFIKDLSTYGTTVDGKKLTPSIERTGGVENDLNIEAPLPPKAKIGLAGVLTLQFRAQKR
jgi:pSer/pThr/pTyr-binding forkhead associated (FHA) protein